MKATEILIIVLLIIFILTPYHVNGKCQKVTNSFVDSDECSSVYDTLYYYNTNGGDINFELTE